jgi:hypothetical protein
MHLMKQKVNKLYVYFSMASQRKRQILRCSFLVHLIIVVETLVLIVVPSFPL